MTNERTNLSNISISISKEREDVLLEQMEVCK